MLEVQSTVQTFRTGGEQEGKIDLRVDGDLLLESLGAKAKLSMQDLFTAAQTARVEHGEGWRDELIKTLKIRAGQFAEEEENKT